MTILAMGHQITNDISNCDILLHVHGTKILSEDFLNCPRMAALNVHPYLYIYHGLNPDGNHPINAAIRDENWHASVGCHKMTDKVDCGEVIEEIFIDVIPSKNPTEIYNQLYPYYHRVIKKSLGIIERQFIEGAEEPDVLVGGLGY